MTGPRSAEVTTVSRILRKDWLTRDLVCCGDEARRSAPGVSRAHSLLRSARASLTALGGAFARQPHTAPFSRPPTPASSAQAADVTCTHSPVAGSPRGYRRPGGGAANGAGCLSLCFLSLAFYGKKSRFGPQPRRSRAARAPTATLPWQRNDRRKACFLLPPPSSFRNTGHIWWRQQEAPLGG